MTIERDLKGRFVKGGKKRLDAYTWKIGEKQHKNAYRAGLTKENDASVKRQSEKMKELYKNGMKPTSYIDGSSKLRYNNFKEWVEIAKICYKRDGYICQHCNKHGGLLHAHHKIPFSVCKHNELWNLITLCASCHNKEHRRMKNEINK